MIAVPVVAVEDRELGAVNGAQFLGGQAEHQGDEGVDFQHGLAAIERQTEWAGRRPFLANLT